MSSEPTFIMIQKETGQEVFSALDYQSRALNEYIKNNITGKHLYVDKYDPSIKFHISKFDKSGLQGNYDDFYSLIRENGTSSPMSKNENKLRNFAGYINRIISYE
jgi:hypothetical protein